MSLGRKDKVPSAGGARDSQAGQNYDLSDGLGTASATITTQSLPTALSPGHGCPPCCHLLSLPPSTQHSLCTALCPSPWGCAPPVPPPTAVQAAQSPLPPPWGHGCTALCRHPLHPVPLGHSLCVRPCHPLSLVPPPQGTGSEHPAVTSHAGAQAGYTPLSPPPAAHPRCLWLHSQPLLFSPHFCGPKHPTVLSLPAINPSRGTDVPGATAPSCLAPGALSILTNAPAQ